MSSENIADAASTVQMYCVKCRTMVTITAPKKKVLKSGRPALEGKCPHCSCTTNKLIKAE